jgi:hypothetical protein
MASPSALKALLKALDAERARRDPASFFDRAAAEQKFINELREIATRLAAPSHWAPPLTADDMSIVEMLAARFFLPEHLQPAGLPSEDEIWAEYERRRKR